MGSSVWDSFLWILVAFGYILVAFNGSVLTEGVQMPGERYIYFDPKEFQKLRKRKGFSQQGLANRAKIHAGIIKNIEKKEGKHGCLEKTFMRLITVIAWKELRHVVSENEYWGNKWEKKLRQPKPDKSVLESPQFFPDNIPNEPKLFGREDQLEVIKERLLDKSGPNRFALRGIPGVGKTVLALKLIYDAEVQDYFKDGILWAGLGQDGDVLAQLGNWAKKLGIASDALAGLTTIENRAWEIRSIIGERRMLLVADDIWAANDAFGLEVGGSRCVHIITTRKRDLAFDYANEDGTIIVSELDIEDGLKVLMNEVPEEIKTDLNITKKIVKEVGGLPLALQVMNRFLRKEGSHNQSGRIEYAFEQLQSANERLKLELLWTLIDQHPSLPSGTPLSLLAAIEVSDKVLKEDESKALRSLAVFPAKPNTFSEEAAMSVADSSPATIYSLSDWGLLEDRGEDRYTIHPTIVDYAQLDKSYTNAFGRMILFFVDFIEKHERDYEIVDQELDNILASFSVELISEMQMPFVQGVNRFYHFLEVRGLFEQVEIFLNKAEQIVENMDLSVHTVSTLLNLGNFAEKLGNYLQAKEYLESGLEKGRQLRTEEYVSKFLMALGKIEIRGGKIEPAIELLKEGLEIAEKLALQEDICGLKINLGMAYYYLGDYDQAEPKLKEGYVIARELGLRDRMAGAMANLGAIAYRRGRYDETKKYCMEGLDIARELRLYGIMINLLTNLGLVAVEHGFFDKAEDYFMEGLVYAKRLKIAYSIYNLSKNIGGMAMTQGEYDKARKYLDEALETARNHGLKQGEIISLRDLGGLFSKQGLHDQAEGFLQDGLAKAREYNLANEECSLLLSLGSFFLKRGLMAQAAESLKQGLEIAQAKGFKELDGAIQIKLGVLSTEQKEFDKAEYYLVKAEEIIQPMNDVWWMETLLIAWGELRLEQKDLSAAEASFSEALEFIKETEIKEVKAEVLFGLARVARAQGYKDEARHCGQESLVIFKEMGHESVGEVRAFLEELTDRE